MSLTVLVSNPAGTVGEHVVRELLEKKATVIAAVRNPQSYAAHQFQEAGVKLVQVNYDDVNSLVVALKDVDKFVFISPLIADHQKISEAWITALKKNKEAGGKLQHVIRLSCFGADDPKTLIGKWHAFIEVLLKTTDIPYTFVRPNLFFQNLSNFFAISIHSSQQLVVPSGKAKIAYLDAKDVAKGLVHIATSKDDFKDKELTLNGSKSYSGEETAEVISKFVEKKIAFVDPTVEEFKKSLTGMLPDILLEGVAEVYEAMHENANLFDTADDSFLKLTGQNPVVLEKFLEEHTTYFK